MMITASDLSIHKYKIYQRGNKTRRTQGDNSHALFRVGANRVKSPFGSGTIGRQQMTLSLILNHLFLDI